MMIVKASEASEAGKMPSEEMLAAMGKYNEELAKAGVLVDLTGLHPSSNGARVRWESGRRVAIDGPFAETKELIGGFWIINVKSRQEAIDWALRIPAVDGEPAEIEIRQFFELEEFGPSEAVDRAKELEKELTGAKGGRA